MNYTQRLAVRMLFMAKLSELYGDEFQNFFDDLMVASYGGDFIDVRTAGRLGDRGADGLTVVDGTLYACYAPESFNVDNVTRKFQADVSNAIDKREGQFETFCFVHNDLRGLHPLVSQQIVIHARAFNSIKFQQWGRRMLLQRLMSLSQAQVEDVLRSELPVQEMTYGLALEDLQPILELLRARREPSEYVADIREVPPSKLEYNRLSGDLMQQIRIRSREAPLIEKYYTESRDVLERDEVSKGFTDEYRRLAEESDDPEDVVLGLEQYILGNASRPYKDRASAMAVISYFFLSCHIFEEPPVDWEPGREMTA